jgi:hypothetical protein
LSGDKQNLCCPRCGEAIGVDRPKATDQSPALDSWELDEQLRHIGRVLHTAKEKDPQPESIERREAIRIDLSHAGPPEWHVPATSPGQPRRARSTGRAAGSRVFTWPALLLGTMSFACGGILLGWSLVAGRQELSAIGWPVALGGQVALLLGLVLQVDRLGDDNRAAVAKLNDVDDQLSELKATATLLGASQGPAASVFYSHFAAGASPQLLLTDLKSQLDLLAVKIARDDR